MLHLFDQPKLHPKHPKQKHCSAKRFWASGPGAGGARARLGQDRAMWPLCDEITRTDRVAGGGEGDRRQVECLSDSCFFFCFFFSECFFPFAKSHVKH